MAEKYKINSKVSAVHHDVYEYAMKCLYSIPSANNNSETVIVNKAAFLRLLACYANLYNEAYITRSLRPFSGYMKKEETH